MRLLLFGPPGVGKGTQAKLLSEAFGVPHISTGDMLRTAIAEGNELGRRARAIMDAGQLVPDDVMIEIVKAVLDSPRASKGFILDGFPRTIQQAKALTTIFRDLHIENYKVVNIDVDDDEIIRRLANRLMCQNDGRIFNTEIDGVTADTPCPSCGGRLVPREDDRADTVRKRLAVYHSTTAPVLQYYENERRVVNIDGANPIDVVNHEIKLLIKD